MIGFIDEIWNFYRLEGGMEEILFLIKDLNRKIREQKYGI